MPRKKSFCRGALIGFLWKKIELKAPVWLGLLFFGMSFGCQPHSGTGDPGAGLEERFNGYLSAIRSMHIDSIQSYTYPGLFRILSPSASQKNMQESFLYFNENARLHAVQKDTIHPVLRLEEGLYTTVIYSLSLSFPDTTAEQPIAREPDKKSLSHAIGTGQYPAPASALFSILGRELGVDVTRYENKEGRTYVDFRVLAIAAKDKQSSQWSFLTITNDQELLQQVFPANVIDTLAHYINNH